MDASELRYLKLLSQSFPTAAKASAEIINLNAILNLPKATEVFASDVHGEYTAFIHLLRNGSGAIRLKLDDAFGDDLPEEEKSSLATLIYYPREKMEAVLPNVQNKEAWYAETILRLVVVCKRVAGKHSRSKVRKAMPPDYAYVLEELITESNHAVDKQAYYEAIIDAVVRTGCAADLIEGMCSLIKQLSIDHLISWGTCTIAARLLISSWTRSCASTRSISSGATMTSYGWAQRSASGGASRTWCAIARATGTSRCSRTLMASTSCRSPRSRLTPIGTTPAWRSA
jgi:hypothetical protein